MWIKTQDGVRLHGWLFVEKRPERARALIIHFHDGTENVSKHYKTLSPLLVSDYDYFIFDYRGYGQSEGKPNPKMMEKDGSAALDWAQSKFSQTPLVVFAQGSSAKTAIHSVAEMKKKIPIEAVVVDSAEASKSGAREISPIPLLSIQGDSSNRLVFLLDRTLSAPKSIHE